MGQWQPRQLKGPELVVSSLWPEGCQESALSIILRWQRGHNLVWIRYENSKGEMVWYQGTIDRIKNGLVDVSFQNLEGRSDETLNELDLTTVTVAPKELIELQGQAPKK